jgi:hypothetical protein
MRTFARGASHLARRTVSGNDDDEDWVGTPPEGRYTRNRAKPEFWRNQRPVSVAAAGLALVVIVLLLIALLR